MSDDFRVQLSAESKKLLDRMARADLGPDMRRALKTSTAEIVPDLKQAARSLPSDRPYKAGGLRARLAKAVTRRIRVSKRGISVTVGVKAQPDVPVRAIEGLDKWRHPVYGTDTWVEQEAMPFFDETVNKHLAKVQREILQVFREFARKLAR